jgi:hypothetical protein
MQIEFHYYITYILARRAGFTKQDSQIIAYASQYTDDNCNELVVDRSTANEYRNHISQTMDIFKPQTVRLKIYPCFHFVPGDVNSELAKRKDGRTHPYNTTPNSRSAQTIMDSVFNSGNLHHMGVCIHCFADTWAHQNFVGCDDDFNSCMGLLEAFIPNIGHADAQYNPDIPSLIWEDISSYNASEWFNSAIQRGTDLVSKPGFQETNWFKFQEAVKAHQRLAWDTIFSQIAATWISENPNV